MKAIKLSGGAVYYAVEDGFQFLVLGWNPVMWPIKRQLLDSTFLWFYYPAHKRFYVLSLYVKSSRVTIQMKAPEKYFLVVCIMLYNRPFATNDHVVQNPPCWRESSLLFLHWHQNKGNSSFTGSGLFVLMSQCRNNNELALQHGGFCTT